MIEIKNLNKFYNKGKKNEVHVLNDINLSLDATGLVCILGESGSGKTTLLNTIGGLDTFSGGSISIDGTSVSKYNPKVMEPIRNDHFDYVFQNYYLLKDYSVAYNIKLALNRYNMTEEEKDARVDYVLKVLGIEKYKKKIVSKLSGGQQQRVSIARALVKSPDIIFADEPTGNLDEENTLRTMSILKNISKECLVLLVTHEKRIANFFADRIIEVQDGKIVRDEPNKPIDSYERSDDSNIYLKEMDRFSLCGEQGQIELYQNKTALPEKLDLTLAWKDGKLYIKNNMNCDILIEGVENGVRMLDEERPKLDMSKVENFSYDLPKLSSGGSAKLSKKEIFRMAKENIQLMGKKQAFVIGILLATAILLSITMAQVFSNFNVNKANVVMSDSHYAKVIFSKTTSRMWGRQTNETLDFIHEFMDTTDHGDAMCIPTANIYISGSGYKQLYNLTQQITDFNFINYTHLKKEDLTYGEMPVNRNDVVLDQRIIDRLAASKTSVASLLNGYEDYLGMKLKIASVETELTVVGICNTNEPSLYCNQHMLMGLSAKGYKIASAAEYLQENSDADQNLNLKDDEILIREALYKKDETTKVFGNDYDHEYKVVGTIPNDLEYDYVMSDKGCQNMKDLMISENKLCYIYTDDAAATAAYFQEKGDENGRSFKIESSVPAEDDMKSYQEAHSNDMNAKTMIPIAITLISLIMVYFTIKSNASSRSEELTVYRLIGISRGSILKAYMLEMILVTSYTSLPAVLLTCGIIQFISSIPSLEIAMYMPWWSALILLICLYAVHVFISILPVYGILSKPPATLAVKD